MRFLVNGSVAYDLLLSHDGSFLAGIDVKNLERLSVNYLAHGYVRHHGGTAANIAWNLALLGQQALAVGAVGTDGEDYKKMLEDRGVDVRYLESTSGAVTATAIIATDSGGRQISFFHPGADALGSFPDLRDDCDDLTFAIMSPRHPPLMLKGAAACSILKIPYLFDPGQVVHAFSQEDLRKAVSGSAGLIVNEYEWKLAAGRLGWDEKAVVKACGMLIETLGDKGLRIVTAAQTVKIPACPVGQFVNPTGAGDAARAGLLTGFGKKWPLTQCGRLAAVMGALVCAQDGTLLDTLDLDEVNALSFSAYGEKLPL